MSSVCRRLWKGPYCGQHYIQSVIICRMTKCLGQLWLPVTLSQTDYCGSQWLLFKLDTWFRHVSRNTRSCLPSTNNVHLLEMWVMGKYDRNISAIKLLSFWLAGQETLPPSLRSNDNIQQISMGYSGHSKTLNITKEKREQYKESTYNDC